MAIISAKCVFVVSVLVVSLFLEITNGDQLTDDQILHESLRFRIGHRHGHHHQPPTPPAEEPPPIEEPPVFPPSGEGQPMPPPTGDEPPCRCDAPSPLPLLVDDQP
uniref:Uncharacterized protein n=1 Tax=Solanum lycopersicum TaxID=4081 RepID=A0A3Q7F3X4_SOLLC|nr:forkhead box protein G1-like [Solanum lycopersicum]